MRYLARHPGMRRQLALVEQDRDVAQRVNAAIVPPRTLSADRLLERARGPASVAGLSRPGLRLWRRRGISSVRRRHPACAGLAAAAVVVMLAQAAVIGGLMKIVPRIGPGRIRDGVGRRGSDGGGRTRAGPLPAGRDDRSDDGSAREAGNADRRWDPSPGSCSWSASARRR